MIIMGVDAGLTSPGFSIVDLATNTPVHYECFIPEMPDSGRKTEKDAGRIGQIVTRMLNLIQQHRPEVIVAELPHGGAKSAAAIKGMAFSTSMTVAALTAFNWGWLRHGWQVDPPKIVYITPTQNKKGALGVAKLPRGEDQIDKWDIYRAVKDRWPTVVWPLKLRGPNKGQLDDGKVWAIADALACVMTYQLQVGVAATSSLA